MRWLVYTALATGMILFGSATPIARFVTQDLPPLVASALRVLIAAVLLYPLAVRRGFRWSRLDRGDLVHAGALAVVGIFGFTVMLAYGMQRVPGVTGSIVMGTTPAVTAIAAVWFLGERATWRRWGAIAFAVAGVVLMRITGTRAHFDLLGVALVFGAVMAEATYTLVGKRLMEKFDPLTTTAVATVLAVPLFVVAAIFPASGVDWSGVPSSTWLAVVAWGAGTLALGSYIWYRGVAQVPGHVAAPFMGLMPVSALVISYWLLGEDPAWWHAVGMGLVLVGIALVVRDHRKQMSESA